MNFPAAPTNIHLTTHDLAIGYTPSRRGVGGELEAERPRSAGGGQAPPRVLASAARDVASVVATFAKNFGWSDETKLLASFATLTAPRSRRVSLPQQRSGISVPVGAGSRLARTAGRKIRCRNGFEPPVRHVRGLLGVLDRIPDDRPVGVLPQDLGGRRALAFRFARQQEAGAIQLPTTGAALLLGRAADRGVADRLPVEKALLYGDVVPIGMEEELEALGGDADGLGCVGGWSRSWPGGNLGGVVAGKVGRRDWRGAAGEEREKQESAEESVHNRISWQTANGATGEAGVPATRVRKIGRECVSRRRFLDRKYRLKFAGAAGSGRAQAPSHSLLKLAGPLRPPRSRTARRSVATSGRNGGTVQPQRRSGREGRPLQ